MSAQVILMLLLASAPASSDSIASYLAPYVRTNNFSGSVLTEKNGRVVFEKSYGFSDSSKGVRNAATTRFHIASMSMQFTAAAVMKLVEQGKLLLDEPVSDFDDGVPNAGKITVRNLLEENSGLPDVNGFDNYSDLLDEHQTPESLVKQLHGKLPARDPGGASQREEHSAFNLLALIVERKTGVPFAEAMQQLVFKPLGMKDSGIDDDTPVVHAARGYEPEGVSGLKPSNTIHWSAKAGNGSAYSSARDEQKWLNAFFGGSFFSNASREVMLDDSRERVGFGWFRDANPRFGEMVYYMNGRAPGFSSTIMYLPREKVGIVVLSNLYISVTTQLGFDIAAIGAGRPYVPANLRVMPLSEAERESVVGRFSFGRDFFQPNATLVVRNQGSNLFLDWPDGYSTALLPVDATHFIDRGYWEDVSVVLSNARPSGLQYDHFLGTLVP